MKTPTPKATIHFVEPIVVSDPKLVILRFVRNSYVAWRPHSFSDTGSDSFLGDCLSNRATSWRPEAGMPTLP